MASRIHWWTSPGGIVAGGPPLVVAGALAPPPPAPPPLVLGAAPLREVPTTGFPTAEKVPPVSPAHHFT